MTKEQFSQLFKGALEVAATNAESKLGRQVPRSFQFLLYGAGFSGAVLDYDYVIDKLYLGENLFYRIIDLSVVEISQEHTKVFTRISQHAPGTFDQTWNTPPGNGPFKQLIAEKIKVVG